MIDYRNEFRRLSAGESNRIIKQHRGLAIGNGLAFNLLLLIPVLGVLLAPPLGAVAAGIAANQVLDKEPNLR
jgi:CysZ protein